jgi:hypothetical protein
MRLAIDEAASLLRAAHHDDDRVRAVGAGDGAIEVQVREGFPASDLPAHYHGYAVVVRAGRKREPATGPRVA